MVESPTARDFVALLPMTLRMSDLFEREKYGHLPRKLSSDARHTREYALGDIAFWPPGPDMAVFYRHDGEAIPNPGIIVLGRVTSGLEALRGRDPLRVKFELIQQVDAEEASRLHKPETRR